MARAVAAIRSSGGRCSGRRRRRAASPRARSSLSPCPARRAPRAPAVPSPALSRPRGVCPLAQVNSARVLLAQPPRPLASRALCVQSVEAAAAASHKNTCLATRVGLPRSAPRPLPLHGDRQPRLLPGGSGGEKLPHARPPLSGARRARPASCQRAREGVGRAEGRGRSSGDAEPACSRAHAAEDHSLPLEWGYYPEPARMGRSWSEGREEGGYRPLGDTAGAGRVEGPSAVGASLLAVPPSSLYPTPASPLQFAPHRSPQSLFKDHWYRMQRQDRHIAPQLAPPAAWAAPRGRSRCRNRRSSSPSLGSERELTFIVPAALRQALLLHNLSSC